MATAKKSTAKKPTPKVKAKSASAKKPATAKKVETKVTTTPTKVASPLEKMRSLNMVSGVIFLILAVVTAVFMASVSAKLTLNVMAVDQILSSKAAILFPANETLFDVQLRYVLAAILALAGIFSLLLATKLRPRYEKSIGQNSSGIRWIFLGVTAGLTLEFVSLIAGINDVMTLKLVGGLIVLTTLFGWIADKRGSTKWMAYTGAVIAGVLAWFPLVGSLVGTTLYSQDRFGWHVYALAAVGLLSGILIATNQYSQLKSDSTMLKFTSREARYLRLDLATKVLIVLIVLTALAK